MIFINNINCVEDDEDSNYEGSIVFNTPSRFIRIEGWMLDEMVFINNTNYWCGGR